MSKSPDINAPEAKDPSLADAKAEYYRLIKDGQCVTASNYIDGVIRQLVADNKNDYASDVIHKLLSDKSIYLSTKYIRKNLIDKIGTKSTKPRLMFCIGFWLTGGMERVMSTVFDQLKGDYEIFLLSSHDGRDSKIEIPEYVTHIIISNKLYYENYDVTALSYALLLDIDAVIGFMNLFEGQLKFYELCTKVGIKTIASNHETYLYPYLSKDFHGLAQKRINTYKSVNAVLWLSNFSAAMYGLLSNNSYLMPNPNTYSVQVSMSGNKAKVILCVGRFNDYVKRVDRILEVFSIVQQDQPDAKLVLVGKYDMNMRLGVNARATLNSYIDELGINRNNIELVGEVSNVEDYYKEATVLLLASMNEGFGMVINEAACFGVPAVASKLPDLEDLIIDGKNGYLVDQDDIKSMADRIGEILADSNLRRELGDNAKKIVEQFGAIKIGDRWKGLLRILLDGKANASYLNAILNYSYSNYQTMSKYLIDAYGSTVAQSSQLRTELTLAERELAELRIERVRTKNELDELKNINLTLSTELNDIYGSKKWRYATKVSNIKQVIKRSKGIS